MVSENKILSFFLTGLSSVFIAFHLFTAMYGTVPVQLQRSFHLSLAAMIGFLCYPCCKKLGIRWWDVLLASFAALAFGYIALNFDRIALRQSLISPLSVFDLLMGASVLLLVLEMTRRVAGLVLSIVGCVALVYMFFGRYFPRMISHPGFSLQDIIDYQIYGLDGVYSMPLGISATYIVLFIILGTLMEYSKTGDVIMDLGKIAAGKYRGGPAKVACVTSAFFGSISGSAAANVYATGTFTIPMMKKIGYKPSIAGAVEAVASTGGQIMPPIMGAAAFLMAELLGIPYLQVCKAALIPAVLYYVSLILVLDFEAAKEGIKGLSRDQIPSFRSVVSRLYLLLPLVLLVTVLIRGYTPFRAAFLAILASFFLSMLRSETRFSLRSFFEAVFVSAKRTVMIAVACAAAGIVIGAITLTGIGLSLSSIIMTLSGGNLLLGLVLIMLCCIVMGMGTPTTVAYVIVATLGVPVMRNFGFDPIPSHFFVFYFAVLSMITPPVAIAAYAAADIAKEDAMKIGFQSIKIATVIFIIPFVFVFDRGLLFDAPVPTIIFRTSATLVSIVFFAGAATGWLFRRLNIFCRVLLVALFLTVNAPFVPLSLAGIGGGLAVCLWLFFAQRDSGFSDEKQHKETIMRKDDLV